MLKRLLLPALALGLGFTLLTTLPSPAAESAASVEKVSKLIAQMGSSEFDDREAAQKQLDAIGEPALDALKKALSSEDTEIRRRAEELVKKIELRTEGSKILQPTKVHLVYKDTPLPEALADFRKQSGFHLTIHDPEGKLKDRKITLDTGETSFWAAFDKFCAAANLVEAKSADLLPKPQPGQPGLPGQPGAPGVAVPPIQIQPVPRPIRALPPQPAVPQKPLGQLQAVQAVPRQAAQPAVRPLPAIQPVPPGGAAIAPGVRPVPQPIVQLEPGQIMLVDGKAKDAPTDYSTSIRIRAMDKNNTFAANEGQLVLGLQVSPEPKITWQNLLNITITKAIDDQGQTLAQGAVEIPNAAPAPGVAVGRAVIIRGGPVRPGLGVIYTGIHQEIPVYLKKGAKNTKALKELTGVLQAQVLSPAKAVITTDDVFKSANKTFHGGEKGWIKIVSATKADNGQVHVKYEMQAPMDIVPTNAVGNPFGIPNGPGVGGPALPRGAFQVRIQVQAQPAIQIVRPVPVGQAVGSGLHAIDDKGKAIPVTVQQQYVQDGNMLRLEYTAIFQLPKDQAVAKLVYSGSRGVTVEVPFTLKDVKLP